MNTVYKYPVEIIDKQIIELPNNYTILSVGIDPNGSPSMWAAVDTEKKNVPCRIMIIGTGHVLPDDCYFLGNIIQGPFVWHAFEYYGPTNF